jgi:hypothetical protein
LREEPCPNPVRRVHPNNDAAWRTLLDRSMPRTYPHRDSDRVKIAPHVAASLRRRFLEPQSGHRSAKVTTFCSYTHQVTAGGYGTHEMDLHAPPRPDHVGSRINQVPRHSPRETPEQLAYGHVSQLITTDETSVSAGPATCGAVDRCHAGRLRRDGSYEETLHRPALGLASDVCADHGPNHGRPVRADAMPALLPSMVSVGLSLVVIWRWPSSYPNIAHLIIGAAVFMSAALVVMAGGLF